MGRSTYEENGWVRFRLHHSKFPIDESHSNIFRGLHIIRDPRDLIISSAKYHTWSDEEWLHIPQEKFSGQTYSEKINSLTEGKERLIFEMDNSAGGQIIIMDSFKERDIFKTIHYEDLMDDKDMYLWHKLSIYLGLEGKEIIRSIEAFWNNSLFGGKQKSKHIQDGSNRQYELIFDDELMGQFNSRFKGVLNRLGYDT